MVNHVPKRAIDGAVPSSVRGNQNGESFAGKNVELFDFKGFRQRTAIAHVAYSIQLRREGTKHSAVSHRSQTQGQRLSRFIRNDIDCLLKLVVGMAVDHEHVGPNVMKRKTSDGIQVGGDFQVAEEQRHIRVVPRATLEKGHIRTVDQNHPVHAHGQVQRGRHMAVVQKRTGIICREFIYHGPTHWNIKRSGRHAIIDLIHIQPVQMNRVAFRTRVGEIQCHLFIQGVFQKRSRQGDEALRYPTVSPNGECGAIWQEVNPIHPGKQLRWLLLSRQRPTHAAQENCDDMFHGITCMVVIIPPG